MSVDPEVRDGVTLTGHLVEQATEHDWRRLNDEDRYRFEPWVVVVP